MASEQKQPEKQKIVICGGGNAAHVFTGLAALNPSNEVHLMSLFMDEAAKFKAGMESNPDKKLIVELVSEKKELKSAPLTMTNDPKTLAGADVVIISLPAFAHAQYLNAIKDNIDNKNQKTTLIAVFPGASGLECDYASIIGKDNPNFSLLSCITLPWACRIKNYGAHVEVLGTKYKVEVCLFATKDADENKKHIQVFQNMFGKQPLVVDHGHLLNMSLGAINAIVHPAIMYGRWASYDGKSTFNEKPLFYQGITDNVAENCLSALSNEVLMIKKTIEAEANIKLDIPHISQWYMDCYGKDCEDTSSLYRLIQTNPGYNGLTHPMKQNDDGTYSPDFAYRYLSEDIPFGLIVIRGLGMLCKAPLVLPVMDAMIQWAQKVTGKEYLVYNDDGTISSGKDMGRTRAPQKYDFKSIMDLV
jgi:ketopantoate reductase